MKLITEYNESHIECLVEKKENGEKDYTIQGIFAQTNKKNRNCLLYTSPSPRDATLSRMPSSA